MCYPYSPFPQRKFAQTSSSQLRTALGGSRAAKVYIGNLCNTGFMRIKRPHETKALISIPLTYFQTSVAYP
ncbi:hypothetical protein LguiB_031760 [Lonicera macranthoides]